jgi:hypothetical protein
MENKDYYVYVHRRNDNNTVFYLGSGRLRRKDAKGRTKTKEWSVIDSEADGHTVEVLYSGLSKDESIRLEKQLLGIPDESWKLVNKRPAFNEHELNIDMLSSLFEYSEDSPSGLVWIGSKHKTRNGKQAGSLQNSNSKQYWVVRKDTKLYLVHRVVMALQGLKLDGLVVDHIDGNGLNNNLENLRVLTQAQNSLNCRLKTNNSSGHTGVGLIKQNKTEYWVATVTVGNRKYVRKFNTLKYLNAKELAISWHKQKISELILKV